MTMITKFALFALGLIVLALFALGVAYATKTLVVRSVAPMVNGWEAIDQLQDYCGQVVGNRVFSINFATATSSTGVIVCGQ